MYVRYRCRSMNFSFSNAFNRFDWKLVSFSHQNQFTWLITKQWIGFVQMNFVSIRLQLPYEWKCWRLYTKLCTKAFSWKASCVIITTYYWKWLHVHAACKYEFTVRKPHPYGLPAIRFRICKKKNGKFTFPSMRMAERTLPRYETHRKSLALFGCDVRFVFNLLSVRISLDFHFISVVLWRWMHWNALHKDCIMWDLFWIFQVYLYAIRVSDLAHKNHHKSDERVLFAAKTDPQHFWMRRNECTCKIAGKVWRYVLLCVQTLFVIHTMRCVFFSFSSLGVVAPLQVSI